MRFVVQEHRGRALHFDFRLEAGGVLKSWAVPKGPSTNPKQKRLAVRTPDHPLDYAAFEGVISDGEYGAGPVIVWDTGTYQNMTERNGQEVPVEEAIELGHVSVWLEGSKLRGGYALTFTSFTTGDDGWLLVKESDAFANPSQDPVRDEPQSVLTGRTLDDVERDAERNVQ
ncbi:MAG: 3'-phosphoesterase [Solirubrobacterales bacterium]|nr:3'-phosphoesterase [Solirubrobacterales bacterium]